MVTAVPDMPCFLIEWYRSDLDENTVDQTVAALNTTAAAMTAEGTPVWLLVTLSVPSDEVLYGLFSSPTIDTVTDLCRRAHLPAQRISGDVAARITLLR